MVEEKSSNEKGKGFATCTVGFEKTSLGKERKKCCNTKTKGWLV